MPHVTFIYPSVGRFPETRYVRSWQMQPLAIGVLSALTPPEWERTFFDDRLEAIDFSQPTDLAAISIETFTARRGYQIAAEYRRLGVPVIVGGYHATFCPEEARQHADAVCIGEAEAIWPQVLRDVIAHRLQALYDGGRLSTLKGLTTDRSIFQDKSYLKLALVETGRGCPFRCSFCSITAFYGGTYRKRPAQDVIGEIREQKSKTVFFVDDNVVGDPESARELFRALVPLRIGWIGQASVNVAEDEKLLDLMARSGCAGLLIGFESFNQNTLALAGKAVNKSVDYGRVVGALRRRGIAVYGTFMFGFQGDSPRMVDDAVRFAREQKMYLAAFNHIVPFPGTPLYRKYEAERRLMYDRWWLSTAYRFGQAPFYPSTMSPVQLERCCMEGRRGFYRARSVLQRGLDLSANCPNLPKAACYSILNLLMKRELSQKFGLPLGVQDSRHRRSYHVEGFLAEASDDAALRNTCWKLPMPGSIRITYLREPGFFDALHVEGRENDVVTGRDTATGQIVGIGSRSTKPAFINGEESILGYLSSLRLLEDYRRGTLLARGYRILREKHREGRARLYITTILERNGLATKSIVSGRAGLPSYRDYGRFHSMAISLSNRPKKRRSKDLDIRPASEDDLEMLVHFWRTEGPRRQFFPAYTVDDFSGRGLLNGLDPSQILMAYSHGRLVGTMAAWDQRSFRQSLVAGYARTLGAVRPLYNAAALWLKYPVLPPAGSYLDYCYLALVCVKEDNRDMMADLLAELIRQNKSGCSFIMAGFHERDPLLDTVRRYAHFSYPSRLYVVSWEDGDTDFQRLDGRVPYLELGAL